MIEFWDTARRGERHKSIPILPDHDSHFDSFLLIWSSNCLNSVLCVVLTKTSLQGALYRFSRRLFLLIFLSQRRSRWGAHNNSLPFFGSGTFSTSKSEWTTQRENLQKQFNSMSVRLALIQRRHCHKHNLMLLERWHFRPHHGFARRFEDAGKAMNSDERCCYLPRARSQREARLKVLFKLRKRLKITLKPFVDPS